MSETTNLPAPASNLENLKRNWGVLAERKMALMEQLRNKTMELQVKPEAETIPALEQWLTKYRANHRELQEMRLGSDFYAALKKIGEDLMQYEKEYDPKKNAQYLELDAKYNELRVSAAQTAAAGFAKNAEIAAFKTHIQNEYIRQAAEWKGAALVAINQVYQECLTTGEAKEGKDFAYKSVEGIALPAVQKFAGNLLTQEEKAAIHKELGHLAPRKKDLLEWAMDKIEEVFQSFEHDLASGQRGTIEQEAAKIAKDAEKTIAVNNLMTSVQPEIVPEGKPIKKVLEVEIYESEAYARSVIGCFLATSGIAEYLSNRKWSTLNIAQMAAAIGKYATETGYCYDQLKYKEVIK